MRFAAVKLACAALAVGATQLVLPAAAPAFQNVAMENGTLRITGDAGKTTDLVTIKYDPATDEYLITHDILTAPPSCRFEGKGPPYKLMRCPAKGIGLIVIDTGNDSDTARLEGMAYANLNQDGIWYPPDLLEVVVLMGLGNDKYEETTVPPPTLPPAAVPAKRSLDMGGGNDGADVGPGANTVVFGDGNAKLTTTGGTNTITIGNGNSQVTVAAGVASASFGSGASKFTGGPGADSAVFGPGAAIFTGKGGDDRAVFGAGASRFYGGPGADTTSLGAGDDFGFGGPGRDRLLGGPGKDRLYGGADFDVLNGGPGKPDRCYGGAGGAKPIGCEFGVQYMPY